MNWFFVLNIIVGTCGGNDCGIYAGYRPAMQRVEIAVPSQEVCEHLVLLNMSDFSAKPECWAKPEPKS